jgi:hypothetical protein
VMPTRRQLLVGAGAVAVLGVGAAVDADAAFAARLPHADQGSFGSGFHDDAYWRSVAPAQIATIAQSLLG